MPDFDIRVTPNERGPVVFLAGKLDLAVAPVLRDCLHELVGQTIMLDFSDVSFLDSTALGVLVAAQKRALVSGGSITLSGVQPAQMKVLELTGLTEHLGFTNGNASAP